MDGIRLLFEENVLQYIVDKSIEFKLGARGLRAICEAIMIDAMFEMPSQKVEEVKINLRYAIQKIEKTDMSRLRAA
jgi:ATP-dependent Clp protease ATP-binding subunit ClpX